MKFRTIKEDEFQSYCAQLHTEGSEISLRTYFNLGEDEVADLSEADLGKVDLSGANLSGANLSGVNLGGADLSGVNLSGADLSGANLSGADLIAADLSGADLGDADLSGADLSGVNFSGASLREANLKGANLFGADLKGADLKGAVLSEVDLRGTNFSRSDLSGAELKGADLKGAYLNWVNLCGADLSGVDLSEAKLSSVILIGAKGLTEQQLLDVRKQGAITKPEELLPALQNNNFLKNHAYDCAKRLYQMAEHADAAIRIRYTKAATEVVNYIHSLPFEQQPDNCQYDQIKENVLVPRIEKGLFKGYLPRNIVNLLVNKYLAKEDITNAASVSRTDVEPLLTSDEHKEINNLPWSSQQKAGYNAVRFSFAEMVRTQRKQIEQESPDGQEPSAKKERVR